MKSSILILTALYAQYGLSRVVPNDARGHGHFNHKNGHNKRDLSTAFVTETDIVTITDYNAVVIVDGKGSVIQTVYNTDATATLSSVVAVVSSTPTASVASPPSTPSQAVSASAASSFVALPSSATAEVSSAVTSINTDTTPTTSTAASTSLPAVDGKGVANTGHRGSSLGGFSVGYDPVSASGCRDGAVDFPFLAGQGVGMIRVYDIGCDLSTYISAAAASNIKLMVGLNGIANLNNDLNTLIGMVTKSPSGWGPVDTVYIGNELVNGGAAQSQDVANAVSTAKGILSGKGFSGNVVTVDTFNKMAADPVICSTSSYCAMNAHPFFDPNSDASAAGTFVRTSYNSVASANGGKRIVITETGWPSQGSANGQAIPSIANQKTAIDAIIKEFASTPGDVFLFQAYDASYKAPGAFGVEPFWGLFDTGSFMG